MRKKRRIRVLIGALVLLFGCAVACSLVDKARVESGKDPLFTFLTYTYEDGGTKVSYGLGYQIIRWNRATMASVEHLIGTEFNPLFFMVDPRAEPSETLEHRKGVRRVLRLPSDEDRVTVHINYKYYEDVQQLFDKADLVVRGVIEGAQVRGYRYILQPEDFAFTVSNLQISHVYKGRVAPGEVIEVMQAGGMIDGVQYEQRLVQDFKEGEEYLLFLEEQRGKPVIPVVPMQGIYYVEDNAYNPVRPFDEIQITEANLQALKQQR